MSGGVLPRPAALAVLDLDGTLVDSVPDLWTAANAMMCERGRGGISEEQVRSFVGNGVERLVHRCLSASLEGDAPPHEFRLALDTFNHLYARTNGRHARVYHGVKEAIERLRRANILRACVTNKPREFTLVLLDAMGLMNCMDLVIGGDEVQHKKPHPEGLLLACRSLGVAPDGSVMLGDSCNDVLAARAAGMAVLCVDYGYNHGQDIRDAAPDAVASSLEDLVRLIT